MKRLIWTAVALLAALAAQAVPSIYMMGDSTMADKDLSGGNPERGWGQRLKALVSVPVHNYARNGLSTKSFISKGLWEQVEREMQPGDYLFIQFGHNDEKVQKEGVGTTIEEYKANLRMFAETARRKGATPVLCTPIVRRKFGPDGKLVDTHGEYPGAVREVARELGVLLLDMERITRDYIEALGDEPSRGLFMWIEPGTVPAHHAGQQDDTHLNVRGGRAIAQLAADCFPELLPELAGYLTRYDFTVAADGRGDFFTLQEAIDAVPDFAEDSTVIFVFGGRYREKVNIPSTKQNLVVRGERSAQHPAVIVYDDYAGRLGVTGRELGTRGSATVYVGCNDSRFYDLTFENDAAPAKGTPGTQAVAVCVTGDRNLFVGCRLLGNQDTLYLRGKGNQENGEDYVHNPRSYFADCYIEGTTDFIFGAAVALFERCEIHSKINSYVTAASTPRNSRYGLWFSQCRLTAAEGVDKVYLGRPWRDYACVAFRDCTLGAHIRPEGWHNWNKPHREKSSRYSEYGSRVEAADGTTRPADLGRRVKWAKSGAKAPARAENPLAGHDDWRPWESAGYLAPVR